MESVEVRFGRGDKRRTLGWFVGDRYVTHVIKLRGGRRIRRQWPEGTYQIEKPDGHIVMRVRPICMDRIATVRMTFGEIVFWLSSIALFILFMLLVFPGLMGHD